MWSARALLHSHTEQQGLARQKNSAVDHPPHDWMTSPAPSLRVSSSSPAPARCGASSIDKTMRAP